MEEKEVKNEVPAPETAKGKEPEKQVKEKKELTPQRKHSINSPFHSKNVILLL